MTMKFMKCFFWAFAMLLPAAADGLRISPVYLPDSKKLEVLVESNGGPAASRVLLKTNDAPNLTLVEDGKPTVNATEFKSFRETRRGMAIVLAVDVSGTMKGQPLEALKKGVSAFLRGVAPQDKVAVVTFANETRVDADFGSSPGTLLQAANRLAPRGNITELNKSLVKCIEMMALSSLPRRKHLVVLTDGKDEGAAYVLDDAINAAKAKGVSVDTIGVTQVDPKYLSVCERLSELTGGTYFHATGLNEIESQMKQLVEALEASPVAVFAPSHLQADGDSHRIGVRFKAADLVLTGEIDTVLPKGPEAKDSSLWSKALLHPYLLGGAGLFLVAVIILAVVLRRRRTARLAAEAAAEALAQAEAAAAMERLRLAQEASEAAAPAATGDPAGTSLAEGPVAPQSGARGGRKTAFQSEFRCAAPAPGRPAAFLRAESGPIQGRVLAIEQDPCWIGSEAAATFSIPQDSFISGFHAYIRWQAGMLYLFDSNSTNGTFKNGQRLAGTSVVISPGDRIRTGHSEFSIMPG